MNLMVLFKGIFKNSTIYKMTWCYFFEPKMIIVSPCDQMNVHKSFWTILSITAEVIEGPILGNKIQFKLHKIGQKFDLPRFC